MSDELNRRAAEAIRANSFYVAYDRKGRGIDLADFDPCNCIEHAWILVERLVKEYEVTLGAWTLEPEVMWFFSVAEKGGDEIVFRKSKSMPEAITLAFLEVVGDSE